MTAAPAPMLVDRRSRRIDFDAWMQRVALIALLLLLGLFILAPLCVMIVRSFTNDDNAFIGLTNFINYFSSAALRQSLLNTFIIGIATMLITVLLAFPYAYAITASRIPFRKLFFVLSLLPLYGPSMLYGIGFSTLFGNQGLLATGCFGRWPIHIHLYIHGLVGIILSEVLATFPPAVLVLTVSLTHRDRRLYEAAESMGVRGWRVFQSVTLPSCLFALISAASIAFVLSTTDYGAPVMLAEKTNVLALDIATKVMGIGQKGDHGMGAVISLVLLAPTVLATLVEMLMRRKQSAALNARSVPMSPTHAPLRDALLLVYCMLIVGMILVVTAAPVLFSLVGNWPYSITPRTGRFVYHGAAFTLDHFNFEQIGQATGGGMTAFYNSLLVAAITAVTGTAFAFFTAYLIGKTRVFQPLRAFARAIAMIPLGLPGMVLGLAYVLIFSPRNWGPLPNPAGALYNTLAILVISNIVHYLGVSFLTASTALAQIDQEFEQVAASMSVPLWRLLLRVTLPICTPAILEIAVYYFVSAMTTVSAVFFLCSASNPLAAAAVVNLEDAGNQQAAAAMAVLILLSNVLIRLAAEPVLRYARYHTQRYTAASLG
jgi:iron(III) transport system permease protein